MKYNARTADVLNEADAFEKRLRVSDFMFTQDQQMFGPSDVDWRPGDPLYSKSGKGGPFGSFSGQYRWSELLQEHIEVLEEGTYYGHVNRRMLDLYDDGEDYEDMRCLTCEVDWSETDPTCWVCGVESNVMLSSLYYRYGFRPMAYEPRVTRVDRYGNPIEAQRPSNHTPGTTIDFNAGVVSADVYRSMVGFSVNTENFNAAAARTSEVLGEFVRMWERMNEDMYRHFSIDGDPGPESVGSLLGIILPVEEVQPLLINEVGHIAHAVYDDNDELHCLQIPEGLDLSGRRDIPWGLTVPIAREDEMLRLRERSEESPNYRNLYESRWRG